MVSGYDPLWARLAHRAGPELVEQAVADATRQGTVGPNVHGRPEGYWVMAGAFLAALVRADRFDTSTVTAALLRVRSSA